MNIALIGNGGREHAICSKLQESKKINNIFCIPGNAGTEDIAHNINIDFLNFKILHKYLKILKIEMVIIGPEEPLVKGLSDFLIKRGISVFGPSKYSSQLEGSKSFVKEICKKCNIPTADFKKCKNLKDVNIFLNKNKFPIVVKADGIASGKGVAICKNKKQVKKFCNEIFSGKFKSSRKLILEEYLEGEELSYFIIVDKNTYKFFGSAQDHKKVGEQETGPNTGGMGAYSPSPLLNNELEKKILNSIINPTLKFLKKRKKPFTGFLYAGLMIKNNEPYLIEYNVRMGDPECQVILPRLQSDLFEIINAVTKNKLKNIKIKWKHLKCMTTVLCSKGYPKTYKKNRCIHNFYKLKFDKSSTIFHAGTKKIDNKLFAVGGRVLNITSTGRSYLDIRNVIIKILKKINWKYGFYRKDIGWRVIGK